MSLTIILLKLSGQACASGDLIRSLARQIKALSSTHLFGVVVGGGNFFRGSRDGKQLGMTTQASHQTGMLATMVNGLIIDDLWTQEGVATHLLCAIDCPVAGDPIEHRKIRNALDNNTCIIFTGGTGNPYFTTDTNAVIRALQINAHELWKITLVDGIYDKDPAIYSDARFLPQVDYRYALDHNLGIVDATALVMAQEHELPIRVFSMNEPDALLQAATNVQFGSILTHKEL
ncbi:MAG: hypothetical protein WC707_02625 [Candidatus Babeliaceae bacterium]|jgi:uridylate kinase